MKIKPKKIVSIVLTVLGSLFVLVCVVIIGIWLFFPYSLPTGGAEDTDGDGYVDVFWDGRTEKMSNFQRLMQ